MRNFKLKRQLRQAGASRQEARELSDLTDKLQGFVPHLDASVKRQIAADIGLHQRPAYARPRFAVAAAFGALIVLSVLAQFAQPGSPLYALKRATDEVRVILQPSLKPELQRQHESEQLKADDKSKVEEAPNIRRDFSSGSGSPSDKTGGADASINSVGSVSSGGISSGSGGKPVDLKVDASGSGSGKQITPVLNVGGSVPNSNNGGPGSGGGSGSSGSGDGLKL